MVADGTTFAPRSQGEYNRRVIATFINAAAVVVGSLIGLLVGRGISERYRRVVFTAVGAVTLVIGMSMALSTQRFLYLALSLVIGGLVGTLLHIEDSIHALGERLRTRVGRGDDAGFATGFLSASVLFCVGALAILGSFQAGVEERYTLLLTKSVMDGFMAILLTAAWGVGVAFSAISILVYQGALTLLAGLIAPWVSELMLGEISGVGGAMVIMIGLNLLDLREIKTADFLPALAVVVVLVLVDPWIGRWVL